MENPTRLRNKERFLQGIVADQSGSIVISVALAAPVLFALTAGVIDYAAALRQKSRLQTVVDAAALAGAKELSLSNAKSTQVESIVATLVADQLKAMADRTVSATPTVTTNVTQSPLKVSVSVSQLFETPFGGAFGIGGGATTVAATARVIGKPNICVLVLDQTSNGALSLEQNALVTGDNCSVYSNSTHNIGIKTKNSARLTATTICSAGGVQGSGSNFEPAPYFDCPQFDDPLASRPAPAVGVCTPATVTEISSSQYLRPGTYCGLTIRNGAVVTLDPGVYVIKDGPLVVKEGASVTGSGVGFFLTGSKAVVDFEESSTINLEAPVSGEMAGLLIFADSKSTAGNQHKIYSANAQTMVGTIYIPSGELRVDGAANVGTESAYTAIVTKTLRIYGGPHVKLNTDYDKTDVPVPDGIRGAGQPIALMK